MAYVIGDLVRVKVTWTDTADALVDPTAVVLRVKDPAGTVVVYTFALGEIVRDSLGVFHRDVATGVSFGWWSYRFEAAGAVVGAGEGSFHVEDSKVI